MKNKLAVITIILSVGIFTALNTGVNAKGLNLFCPEQQKIIIILKNEANMDVSKDKISKIPHIKITNIKDRNKEWSKMVNKMDLPNIENPFKNEITVKINKNANLNEIYNNLKETDFVENIQIYSESK